MTPDSNQTQVDEILDNLAFEVADRHFRKTGVGYAARRKLDDKDVAKAKAAIQALLVKERIAEVESHRGEALGGGKGGIVLSYEEVENRIATLNQYLKERKA